MMARVIRKRKLVEPPKTPLAALMEKHLEDLRVKNYSEYTIKGRRVHIQFFWGIRSNAKGIPG